MTREDCCGASAPPSDRDISARWLKAGELNTTETKRKKTFVIVAVCACNTCWYWIILQNVNAYCVFKKCRSNSPLTGFCIFTMTLTVFAVLLAAVTRKFSHGGTIKFLLLYSKIFIVLDEADMDLVAQKIQKKKYIIYTRLSYTYKCIYKNILLIQGVHSKNCDCVCTICTFYN